MSTLPRLLVILDRAAAAQGCGDAVEAAVAAADAGARFFQVRAKELPPRELWAFAERAALALAGFSATVVVNERADVALALGLRGVHRPQAGLPVAPLRRLMESQRLIGVSCHDAGEVDEAQALGADYVTLSPIYATASKPGAEAIGLSTLRALAASHAMPIYALGGVTPDLAAECLAAGARGVAVLSGIMAAADPYEATRAYLAALDA